ncbi:hypothetical protein ARC78_12780 [Stenotrophomonas pictorum JCM 9942]|uniref:Uncharacterized protein n=1 Tax=Stenotrophomonas pictorum JCM 9942 TaxID=1236960 RepID=A0A0R0A5A5_9GAMM|nr:hypothetical protein [Stenotrophomonas pictorum]KRG40268.1 hypothetical protein ARC78_12780 [Stenotrophomonas pictorum JCM 9942]
MNNQRDRDFVDVTAELGYWRTRYSDGALIGDSFINDCNPVIKLACDIYIRNPHGTRSAWHSDLHRHLSGKMSMDQRRISDQIAGMCWDRLVS